MDLLVSFCEYWNRRETENQRKADRLDQLGHRDLAKRFRGKWVRVIHDRDSREPYLVRYYICSTRWLDPIVEHIPVLRWLSFRVVLHHTLQSDNPQCGLHDHPWPWASWILRGGYLEHTPEGVVWRAPGSFRFRSADSFHRLELAPMDNQEQEVVSLFLMGPREKEWGFLDRTGNWVQWRTYLNLRKEETEHE